MTVTLQPAPAKTLPCADDPELFYPLGGKSVADREQIKQAIDICRRCPALTRCGQDIATWPRSLRDVGMVAAGHYWRAGADQYDRTSSKPPTPAPQPAPHGDLHGYYSHKNRGQQPCDACRDAYNAYRRACRANSRQGAAA